MILLDEAIDKPEVVVRPCYGASWLEFWDDVKNGIQSALDQSENEHSLTYVEQALSQGALLFVAADDHSICGAAITEWLERENEQFWLNVPYLYSDNNHSVLVALFDAIEKYGESYPDHCIGIKWVSSHPRAEVIAKRRKYRKRFVEFVKEI
jgi:hypothetical protein